MYQFPRFVIPVISVLCLSLSCGDGDASRDDGQPTQAAAQSTGGSSTSLPARDPALAPEGQALFTARACVSCHTIGGGRLVGPDLKGVTDRRSREWILSMILNPDSMLRTDTTARRLLGEYFTPMVNQGLSPNDAVAMYEYLLTVSDSSGDGGGAH